MVMLGLRADPNEQYIEYGPRPPLVIPGDSDLPAPEERVAENRADWPDDPDVRARRERQAIREASASSLQEVEEASRPMSRAELDEWGQRFGRRSEGPPTYTRRDPNEPIPPQELSSGIARASSEAAGEPPRRRLSDPPAGYRQFADTGDDEEWQREERRGFFSRVLGSGRSSSEPPRTGRERDPTRDY